MPLPRSLPTWWPGRPAVPERTAGPPNTLTLGLGSRSTWAGVGAKATMLHRAVVAGLSVPVGFVVPDEPDRPAVALDPAAVEAWARTAHPERRIEQLAVRSAFSAEDGQESSMAGWFHTELNVAIDDVSAAVAGVRGSGDRLDAAARFRRDVLVMEMVQARWAGVAFSEPGTYDDLVNATTGVADGLVSGAEAGNRLLLARLELAEGPSWRRRLQRLLAEVRAAFGDRPWDVEWADDGDRCWLIQLRPITAPTRRPEILTIANHAEILPALPSRLMTSVIAEAGPELFDWYRRFDRTLPSDRPFLVEVAGRPFINLTLLEDLLRHLGLPTALVAESLGGFSSGRSRPANPRQAARRFPVLARMGLAMAVAVVRADANARQAASFGRHTDRSFSSALDELGRAHVCLVTGMFPLSSAIGPPLALLRATGTLASHASGHQTITTELAEVMAITDPDDRDDVDAFLRRFGHRGVYESDIARPRYADDPSLFLVAAGTGRATDDTSHAVAPDRSTGLSDRLKLAVTAPVWAITARPMAARERLRHEAMRSFATIRSVLVRAAERAVDAGQLRSVDDLWLLEVDEARRLDQGWRPDAGFWAEREAEVEAHRALTPPPVVPTDADPADWTIDLTGSGDQPANRLRGLALTEGTVRGRAWVLDEPSVELPPGFEPGETVLVARSIDAGWIPTMASVAAVVAEIGGDLSHGSILIRERGVPAVTNVAGVTRAVATGDLVEVRAASGTVEVIEVDR